MKLNRRTFSQSLALSAIAATATGAFSAGAFAQSFSPADLHSAPAIGDKTLGPDDASVIVVEYASATCPHCAAFHNGTFKELKSEFIDTGKIKFISREFPLDDLALAGFMVARCVPDDKYFGMLDLIYEQQRTWAGQNARTELLKMAKLAGLSEADFDACLKNEDLAKGILAIRKDGAEKFDVKATPTFYVNGKKLEGNRDIAGFRKAIEAAASS
ncbi:thioredoxin domain-containing protein [Anderseniella sp. Alg231-50]|uniref:thioredoxin domain-containing protein n=1 Tax=Anderseniella sp. Alg231-50 TaxID=1922226 RepID=UPI000D55859E